MALRLMSRGACVLVAVLAVELACSAAAGPPRGPSASAATELLPALERDTVLAAMLDELERSADKLALPGYEAPYYLAYAIKDADNRTIGAKLGSVYQSLHNHTRSAYVDVRVGDYSFDSSEDPEGDWVTDDDVYNPATLLPVDSGTAGLRHTLWLLTDLRYKQALSSYLKLKGQRVYEAKEKERPSFSPAPAKQAADAPVALTMDQARWTRMAKRMSALIGDRDFVFDGEVQIDFGVETRWFVNTEGTRLRTVQPMYAVHAVAYARAEDGMLLDQSLDFYAPTEGGLPADAELERAVTRMLDNLDALRKAEQLDPYTGPAILEPKATGVFFHEVLGHRLEGHRQDDDNEGRTFAAHLGEEILPPFISVVDDPTRRTHGETPLNGHYAFDDEGVASEPVYLVEKGVLKRFLLPRRPVKGFKRSNGHGRAQSVARPVARMGNTIVEAHQTVSRARLKERLLEEVRAQGKPFGLIVRDITGGATNTSSYGYQAFKGEARMVYKVDAESGEETLVRGVEIVGTPLISLGKIVAASDETGVFNGYCGAESGMVPVSTVAPATLFSEIELQRAAKARSRGPILPSPPRTLQGARRR